MARSYQPIRLSRLDRQVRQSICSGARLCLCQEDDGQPGRDYLLKERGLDWETIANFRLGYMPFSSGSSFAGRIIMPIYDAFERDYYVSARPATADKAILDDVGKYWNESFLKGEHLFGLNIAKHSIVSLGFAIVVEGQMDVMAMHSYGFTNTVGILGGSFTLFHMLLLKRLVGQVVLLLDGDAAGRSHVSKALASFVFKIDGNYKTFGDPLSTAVILPGDDKLKDPDLFLKANGAYLLKREIATKMDESKMTYPASWFRRTK